MAQIARFYQDCTLALTFAARQLSLIFLQSSFRCQIVRIPGSKPMSLKYIPYSCHAKSLWTLVDTFLPSRIWIISVHPHILTSPIRYAAQSIISNLWDGETSLPQLDKALSCQAQLNMLAARLLVLRQQPCEPMCRLHPHHGSPSGAACSSRPPALCSPRTGCWCHPGRSQTTPTR